MSIVQDLKEGSAIKVILHGSLVEIGLLVFRFSILDLVVKQICHALKRHVLLVRCLVRHFNWRILDLWSLSHILIKDMLQLILSRPVDHFLLLGTEASLDQLLRIFLVLQTFSLLAKRVPYLHLELNGVILIRIVTQQDVTSKKPRDAE